MNLFYLLVSVGWESGCRIAGSLRIKFSYEIVLKLTVKVVVSSVV